MKLKMRSFLELFFAVESINKTYALDRHVIYRVQGKFPTTTILPYAKFQKTITFPTFQFVFSKMVGLSELFFCIEQI